MLTFTLLALPARPSAPGDGVDPPEMKRVLLLHQEGISRPFRTRFDAAFIEALRADESDPVDLDEESIAAERFPGPQQSQFITDYLRKKYAGRQVNVIVAVGNRALTFARDNRAMFGDPAIVAIASPGEQIDATSNSTGLKGGRWFIGTVGLAFALLPDTRTVFVIDGTHDNPGDAEEEVRRDMAQRSDLALVYLRDLPFNELLARVAEIPAHSIVLFVRQTIHSPTEHLDPMEALSQVAAASPVPVFAPMEESLGRGVLGGYAWRFEADARRLAEMARSVAYGADPRTIPAGRATYTPLVDARQLQAWHIPESRLPAGTVVMFRQPSFFDVYKRYVFGGLIVFAVQFALIIGLFFERGLRRRAEAKTATSEEQYRSVVETQSDLICRFLPDSTLTFVNDAYCRFWGKTRGELLGTKFVNLIPPAARAEVLDRISKIRDGVHAHEHPVTLPNGATGWHHWINQPIVDLRGNFVELQGVGRDVTDRKHAENAISDLEARKSAMLRAIPDLMFVMASDGTYVDYHARDPKLLFVPPEMFLGKKIRDVMPQPLADIFMNGLERAISDDQPVVVEYELQLGQPRYFEARLVRAEHDRVLSMVRDVTESKQSLALNRALAGRLIAAQEVERQRIARELHDDLGQKIALLNIEIDQIAAGSPVEQRVRLQAVSTRAADIASDIHHLSYELHPSKLQTLGLVAAIQSLCREITHQSSVQVSFASDLIVETVDQDVSLGLYRIAQEALHNVARHSQATEASVQLRHEHDELFLEIVDRGVGFNPRGIAHEGLGLVSMRERASLLKGKLQISAAHGGGTRITARIPYKQERPRAGAGVSTHARNHRSAVKRPPVDRAESA